MRPYPLVLAQLLLLVGAVAAAVPARAMEYVLENDRLRAVLNDGALVRLVDVPTGRQIALAQEGFTLRIDGAEFTPQNAPVVEVERRADRIAFWRRAGERRFAVVYELRPGWGFVSKHVEWAEPVDVRLERLELVAAELAAAPLSVHRCSGGRHGGFLRFAAAGEPQPALSLMVALQNPFLDLTADGRTLRVAYAPDMTWKAAERGGPFVSDRACLGLCLWSGSTFPGVTIPEWKYEADPAAYLASLPQVDVQETLALTDCVRQFLLFRPTQSTRIHVDWCENAYQLDLVRDADWAQYERIIRQAAAVGCRDILFSPHDSELASERDNRDAWGWEQILWFNLGQKLRQGTWTPGRDPLPESVQQRIAFAEEHGVRLTAYVYPSLPFAQDPSWTEWVRKLPGAPEPGGYLTVDSGLPSYQDWLLRQLVEFQRQTGCGGYSFDHWWIAYDDSATSKYAQWHGCRRILEELRKACPDLVIDGRQQYHQFGPWTWLAGSYPHPLATDEQPQSFRTFPDLHWSRGSADRQRHAAWWFRMLNFCPPEIMPGYMTHQSMRNDAAGVMRRDAYRLRDWDYLGWKYSVISSIATAPAHHVVNYLPARDEAEFAHFTERDQAWLREWLDWTDEHLDVLLGVRPILGPPMVGRCDGSAAVAGDRGFVFLFNPNYRALTAETPLDAAAGFAPDAEFALRQLYPDELRGRWLLHPDRGWWRTGDTWQAALPGASAAVVEVVPRKALEGQTLLGEATGQVAWEAGELRLTDVQGDVGTQQTLRVLLPDDATVVERSSINGRPVHWRRNGPLATTEVTFAGEPGGQCLPLTTYDPQFASRRVEATLNVPQRVFEQLDRRREAWPIPYNQEELDAPWTAPHRLLLFVNIADPDNAWEVAATLDGKPLEVKKAYSSVYDTVAERTFIGFYVDLTAEGVGLEAGRPYRLEVELPDGLQPGQFQGLFLDNVETEYTTKLQ